MESAVHRCFSCPMNSTNRSQHEKNDSLISNSRLICYLSPYNHGQYSLQGRLEIVGQPISKCLRRDTLAGWDEPLKLSASFAKMPLLDLSSIAYSGDTKSASVCALPNVAGKLEVPISVIITS